ncbi:hypothetical protein MRAB57_4733 [Mycobacterium rhizamassiliense]|jgi:hypothetical protein|uniref:Uncharacterized protein n=2 Tax=Mycobacterium rhizamassiliense TaxID=1841860 RepID=A0A2U3NZG7_9MYCO|nr:hypothetical protein MRAB57_4733 [Mycobacterium rhizamassiliense]
MTVLLLAMCALAAAACFGYCAGRRAASTPPTWKRRTSRVALGRLAIGLLVAVAARQIRRRFAFQRVLSGVLDSPQSRTVAPLQLLRGGAVVVRRVRLAGRSL